VITVKWDPARDTGVYIKVNCISTEFTPKKHGGEKVRKCLNLSLVLGAKTLGMTTFEMAMILGYSPWHNADCRNQNVFLI
jgi:CP2 transcription factor